MTPAPVEVEIHEGWRIEVHDRVDSTNTVARDRPPWTAIRAISQTGGKGRFERAWFSPPGGLWTTLVLPHKQPAANISTSAFPLAVGQTLVVLLRHLGLSSARLRWPNDLMLGGKKAGGVLMELQFNRKLLLGLGLNVRNPLPEDPPPETPATRLADHLDPCPEPDTLLRAVLESIAGLHARFFLEGFTPYMEAINASIAEPQPVEIQLLRGSRVTGLYAGVDDSGNPVLRGDEGGFTVVPACEVARLKEL